MTQSITLTPNLSFKLSLLQREALVLNCFSPSPTVTSMEMIVIITKTKTMVSIYKFPKLEIQIGLNRHLPSSGIYLSPQLNGCKWSRKLLILKIERF